MRLPFVSRAFHEAVVLGERARALTAEAQLAATQERLDKLMDVVLTKAAPPERPAPQDADPLTAIIRARAGNNGTIRRALGNYVKNARAQGVEEKDIQDGLTNWASSDDEGVD